MKGLSKLLWLDCLGGMCVGNFVLCAYRMVAEWDNLDPTLTIAMGLVNLVYGCYSFSLAARANKPMRLVTLLAVANMAWAPICFAIVAFNWNAISTFGLIHVGGEGVYVGALGYAEWHFRYRIAAL